MKVTLSAAKTACAPVTGKCLTDERLLSLINQAQERLLYEGNWVGTVKRYLINPTSEGEIIWPRDIETILAWWYNSSPGVIRNEWYETLEGGPGRLTDSDNSYYADQLIDRGETCTPLQVVGSNKKLRIYSEASEDTDAYIILRFLDENSKRVRTVFNGSLIDGEKLALAPATTYQTTTNLCVEDGILEVVKPKTNGVVRLVEWDTTTGVNRVLAYFEPSEEVPTYRVSFVPGLEADQQVEVLAKVRFMPAVNDDDVLLIQHIDAIRLAVQAVQKEKDDQIDAAAKYWTIAIRALQKQLESHHAGGTSIPIRMANSDVFGAGFTQLT